MQEREMQNMRVLIAGFLLGFNIALMPIAHAALFNNQLSILKHDLDDLNVSRLMISTTGEGVDISLDLPDIEHFLKRAALDQTTYKYELKQQLADGAALFKFNEAAQCKLTNAEVLSDYLELNPQQWTANTMMALDVTWSFYCVEPQALKNLQTQLFAKFSQGFEQLWVDWVTEANEASFEMSEDTLIQF